MKEQPSKEERKRLLIEMMKEDEKNGVYEKSSPEWVLAEELTKRIIIALQNTFAVSNEPSDETWKALTGDWEEFIHDKLKEFAQQFKEGLGQKEASQFKPSGVKTFTLEDMREAFDNGRLYEFDFEKSPNFEEWIKTRK